MEIGLPLLPLAMTSMSNSPPGDLPGERDKLNKVPGRWGLQPDSPLGLSWGVLVKGVPLGSLPMLTI